MYVVLASGARQTQQIVKRETRSGIVWTIFKGGGGWWFGGYFFHEKYQVIFKLQQSFKSHQKGC